MVQSKEIKAHRVILSSQSSYFAKELSNPGRIRTWFNNHAELRILDLETTHDFQLVELLIRCCYNPLLAVTDSTKLVQLEDINSKYSIRGVSELLFNDGRNLEGYSHTISWKGRSTQIIYFIELEEFSDVKVIVKNEEFRLHRCILASRSEWFSVMLSHQFKESVPTICLSLSRNLNRLSLTQWALLYFQRL